MKKLKILMFATLVAIAVSGCGKDEKKADKAVTTTEAAKNEKDEKVENEVKEESTTPEEITEDGINFANYEDVIKVKTVYTGELKYDYGYFDEVDEKPEREVNFLVEIPTAIINNVSFYLTRKDNDFDGVHMQHRFVTSKIVNGDITYVFGRMICQENLKFEDYGLKIFESYKRDNFIVKDIDVANVEELPENVKSELVEIDGQFYYYCGYAFPSSGRVSSAEEGDYSNFEGFMFYLPVSGSGDDLKTDNITYAWKDTLEEQYRQLFTVKIKGVSSVKAIREDASVVFKGISVEIRYDRDTVEQTVEGDVDMFCIGVKKSVDLFNGDKLITPSIEEDN